MSQLLGSQIEQAIAGMLLNSQSVVEECVARLGEGDFTTLEPKLIFRAAYDMLEEGNTVDPLTVAEWIRARQGKDLSNYIEAVVNAAPGEEAADTYLSLLKGRTAERRLIGFRELTNVLAEGATPIEERVAKLQEELEKVSSETVEDNTRTIAEVFDSTLDQIASAADGDRRGLVTGFNSLDEMTGGLQPGDLVIVAGRPSMGKTSFAMNIAENVAMRGERALIFSMEMPNTQLAMRMISGLGRVDLKKLRTGELSEDELGRIEDATGKFGETAMLFNDMSGLSFPEMRLLALKAKRKHGKISMVVIDYIQLMEGDSNGRNSNRNEEITRISRGLKKLAKELDCPVVALSQLSRDCEKRADKRPMNSDLRESGAIEQDADVILFVYRDEVYNPNTRFKGISEIIIGKQRNGPIGVVELQFDRQHSRFENAKERPAFVPSAEDSLEEEGVPFGF